MALPFAYTLVAVEDDMNEEQQGTLGFISRMGDMMLETVELRKVFKGKTAVEEVSLYLDRENPSD